MHCHAIHDLLLACQKIEQQLNNQNSSIAKLMPRFFVVGSLVEGTRLFRASEGDMTVEFLGLHQFSSLEDATSIKINGEDIHLLKRFVKKGTLLFDYPEFLFFFMECIQSAISILKSNDELFQSKFGPLVLDHSNCDVCKKENSEQSNQPMTHDENCLPTVCHTKIGACLILPWKFNDSHGWTMAADLVPVFPIKGQTLELINKVMKTLLENNPPGWRKHTESFYERDIFLPEGFLKEYVAQDQLRRNQVENINIKLLNYNDENNQVIRPAQRMDVGALQSNVVFQQAYIHIKALNTILEAKVKSYMVKKVLLQKEFFAKSRVFQEGSAYFENEKLWQFIVFDVLHHQEMKKHFDEKIDYSKWSREKCWEIPLKETTFNSFQPCTE